MAFRLLHLLRALCVVLLYCALARAQSSSIASDSSGGSVLRQVSGIEGLEPYHPQSTSVPPSYAQPPEVFAPQPDPLESPEDGKWIGPHRVGRLHEFLKGEGAPLPESIIPSLRGPRTPQALRFKGPGQPLLGTSWNNRPFSAGWFVGGIEGGQPLAEELDYGFGFFGGFRLGWDYDYYYGLETRIGASALPITDLTGPTDPRTGDLVLWDIDLLYYPWGDSAWRPYFMIGLGLAHFQFTDANGDLFREGMFAMPIGIGLKYRWSDYLVLRGDFTNNLALIGNNLSLADCISLSLGVEVRFGGTRTSYWPWNPSRHLW